MSGASVGETLEASPGLDPPSDPVREPELLPPSTRIGPFILLRHLGSGGMGAVYSAYDEALDRKVALKLLHVSELGGSTGRAEILREAQAMARLSHANVVHVYDVGEVDDRVFLAMEFIDGQTLAAWQRAAPRSASEVLAAYRQVGRGLAASHAAGVVHRDVKPENALIDREGRVRLIDFGHSRPSDHATLARTSGSASLSSSRLLEGTPAYMAPEQLLGERADAASDQFAFCVAVYIALYGQRPFAGDTFSALRRHVTAGSLRRPPAHVDLPVQLFSTLQRGLSRDPADRWGSMSELVARLDIDLSTDPAALPRLRRRLILAMGVFLAVITVLADGSASRYSALDHLLAAVGTWAGICVIFVVFRRRAAANAHHLNMLRFCLAGASLTVVCNGLLALADLPVLGVLLADALTISTMLAIGALLLAPWLAAVSAVFMLCAALAVALPAHAWTFFRLEYPLAGLCFVILWYRTSAPRAPARPPGGGPSPG